MYYIKKLKRLKDVLERYNYFADFNKLYYAFKRNKWVFDFTRYFKEFSNVKIDRPIFLLGTQGGGLTLISRMLRRNKNVISVTGNNEYWAGADEIKSVLGPILPSELKSIEHKKPYPKKIKIPTGWFCGINEYVDLFRNSKKDVTPEMKENFRKILRWIIYKYSKNKKGRLVDKSQTYTLKVSFLNDILNNCHPKFLLITRNPYAMCYRAAEKRIYTAEMFDKDYSFIKRLDFACQHWSNYMKYATEDSKKVDNFMTIKFEYILNNPKTALEEICNYLELNFEENMLPKENDKIPFGTIRRNRWYPLRPEVNKKYINKLDSKHIKLINNYCIKYIRKFKYQKL